MLYCRPAPVWKGDRLGIDERRSVIAPLLVQILRIFQVMVVTRTSPLEGAVGNEMTLKMTCHSPNTVSAKVRNTGTQSRSM